MHSRWLLYVYIHAILRARSSRCDWLDPCHQVTLLSPFMRHASTCLMLWRTLAHHSTSMSMHAVYTNMKPCCCTIAHQIQNSARYSPWKLGIPIVVFSYLKLGENSTLCAMTHLRRSTVRFLPPKHGEMLPDFCRGNLATIPNTLGKHRSRPLPFRNQTSKPNIFKAPKAKANSSFLIANVLKLWFYQNKGLSTDMRCREPNTFPIHNQTFEIKNQDLPIHIRLGKTIFFLA